jgi:hypothetical protein
MKRSVAYCILALMLISLPGIVRAQLPTPGAPLNLDLGLYGGTTLPLGTLADSTNSGWHAGAKARFSGFMPLSVLVAGQYNRIPMKTWGESMTAITVGAGLEYPLTAMVVKPYLGVDGFVSILSSTAPGAASVTREGIGLGGGVQFSVPAFGSFDLSAKYQMINLLGKETNEETQSQLSVSLAIMFSVL